MAEQVSRLEKLRSLDFSIPPSTTPERPRMEKGFAGNSFEMIIAPRTRELGDGVQVRRALPYARRRMVGPFVFFDQMGPLTFNENQGIDVRPHPHIGLATVTYLFDGVLRHRDSLGTCMDIVPGEVNWMTAGKGIVHSERTPPKTREGKSPLFGIQTWVALPREHEEAEPDFLNLSASQLPVLEGDGAKVRVIAGKIEGKRSPLPTFSETLYADIQLENRALFASEPDTEERALYVVSGSLRVIAEDGSPALSQGNLYILHPGKQVVVQAQGGPARLMLVGGASLNEPRLIWWNFVSSSRDRIVQAAEDWRNGKFQPVPEDPEFIPLPEGDPPRMPNYP